MNFIPFFIVGFLAWGFLFDWNPMSFIAYALLFMAMVVSVQQQKVRAKESNLSSRQYTYKEKLRELLEIQPETFVSSFMQATTFMERLDVEPDAKPTADITQAISLLLKESSVDKERLNLALRLSFEEYQNRSPSDQWIDYFLTRLSSAMSNSSVITLERADLLKSLEAVRHSIDKADDQDRVELSNLLKLLEKNSKE
jgi:hypothetical protein